MNLTTRKSVFAKRMCRSALSALILLAASASFAQKVHVEFNKGVDFSKFKTYSWLESKHPAQGAWAKQVVADIDRQLTRKGLKKVDAAAGPDLQVVYNAGVKERSISAGCDYGCVLAEYLFNQAYGPRWFWPEPGSWVSEVENNGNLVVDLVDASSKDMVWRGVATDTLSDKTKTNEHKLNKVVRRMFKKYPPKKA